MNLPLIQTLARKHIAGGAMESSARLCLADSLACAERDDWTSAADRALASLRFSVGVFHPDFKRAERVAKVA